jgi:hypothetical protein
MAQSFTEARRRSGGVLFTNINRRQGLLFTVMPAKAGIHRAAHGFPLSRE